ncbi:restriction endonuclease subunit S [Vibrio caribbeanicus]|uniref:restriction endonuclease subunit S n=1 Tax=Vibrio caribbeanicus TaxID=701175 RepID=UPI00068D2001|nr:restriction endonuclease subunit S [Vibrio caribbeanicus]
MTKQINVPNIRFAEYVDAWETTPLSDLVVSVDSGWSPQCDEGSAAGPEWGVLKTTSVQWTGFEPDKNKKLPKALEPRNSLSLKQGDILVTRAGPNERVGVVSLVDKDYPNLMLSDKIIRLRTKPEINPSYLTLNLCLKKSNYQIMRKASGLATSQTNISQKFLLQTKLSIPTFPEQQKIASFLSKVDEKIALLTEKKDKLTEYKKGVMQQLFNGKWEEQGGQLTFVPPTLRFKADDDSEFPDWEERKLADLGSFIGGGTPDTKNADYWAGETPWISSSDVIEGNIFQIERSRFITDEAIATSATKIVPANSILIVSRVGVGKFVVSKHEICTSQDFSNFTPEQTDVTYMAYNLYVNKHKLEGLAQGTSIKGFTTGDLKSLKLGIPCIEEQTKIANFLSVIDEKVALTNSELEKTKEWKKGLLQQMFV